MSQSGPSPRSQPQQSCSDRSRTGHCAGTIHPLQMTLTGSRRPAAQNEPVPTCGKLGGGHNVGNWPGEPDDIVTVTFDLRGQKAVLSFSEEKMSVEEEPALVSVQPLLEVDLVSPGSEGVGSNDTIPPPEEEWSPISHVQLDQELEGGEPDKPQGPRFRREVEAKPVIEDDELPSGISAARLSATSNWHAAPVTGGGERSYIKVRQRLDEALRHAVSRIEEDPQNVDVIIQYLGWDGSCTQGADLDGQPFELSIDRVKQIVDGAIDRLSKDQFVPQAIEEAIMLAKTSVPMLDNEVCNVLLNAKLR
jgi:hypothetical protein